MHPAIAQHRASIAAICQRYGIHRLEVFGSAARGDDFVLSTLMLWRRQRMAMSAQAWPSRWAA